MATEKSKTLGAQGELIAAMRLQLHGYKIREKNWRFKHKEIDIIAEKDNKIIFVEVKTRSNTIFETPSEAVTLKKQRLIIEAANQYLIQRNIELDARFDVVSVLVINGREEVEIIENAFYPIIGR